MKITFEHNGIEFTITTNHSASSYGQPALIVDGSLTDTRVEVRDADDE